MFYTTKTLHGWWTCLASGFFLMLKYYYPLPLHSPSLDEEDAINIIWMLWYLQMKDDSSWHQSVSCLHHRTGSGREVAHPASALCSWEPTSSGGRRALQLYRWRHLSSHPWRYFLKLAFSELPEGVRNGTEPYGTCIKEGVFFILFKPILFSIQLLAM